VRGTDLVARYGGEEFAVLLVETPSEAGLAVAERLRASVEALALADLGIPGTVTISVGEAGFPESASDERGLIEKADEALYAAKREGKNRVVAAGTIGGGRGAISGIE
jgi:diguanylate cyclase (GGDEF)-like protein